MDQAKGNLTVLMDRAGAGDRAAAAELLPLVYDQLRAMAQKQLAHEPADITLQATALVHEAYLRLGADPQARWEGRRHYFGAAAIAMRRILVERARRKAGPKQGGDRARVPLEEVDIAADAPVDWAALDDALAALERHDPQLAELVSLRYFAGLTVPQLAMTLGVSDRSVDRDWAVARAFLRHHLAGARGKSA